MTTAGLLAGLRPSTDLARLVVRVSEGRLPWVAISRGAVAAWARRDPEGWTAVAGWLAERDVDLVRIPGPRREAAATA
jgi:hypothetical protein